MNTYTRVLMHNMYTHNMYRHARTQHTHVELTTQGVRCKTFNHIHSQINVVDLSMSAGEVVCVCVCVCVLSIQYMNNL